MIIRPEEWIMIPDEEGDGLLEAWVGNEKFGFPIPIETHKVSLEDIALNRDQAFLLMKRPVRVRASTPPWRLNPLFPSACFPCLTMRTLSRRPILL